MIGDTPEVREALQKLGGETSLVDAYLSATLQILALIAAAYTIQATLRLRAEETSGRAEPLLATATSRTSWALSHAMIALAGTMGLMLVTGIAAGIGHAAQTGDLSEFFRVLNIAVLQAPAAWVLGGDHPAALRRPPARPPPRPGAPSPSASRSANSARSPTSPRALIDASPFAHGPTLGTGPGLAPIVLTLIALALAALGLTTPQPPRPNARLIRRTTSSPRSCSSSSVNRSTV